MAPTARLNVACNGPYYQWLGRLGLLLNAVDPEFGAIRAAEAACGLDLSARTATVKKL